MYFADVGALHCARITYWVKIDSGIGDKEIENVDVYVRSHKVVSKLGHGSTKKTKSTSKLQNLYLFVWYVLNS